MTIHLGADERIGVFGPNGHGKTTLLRTISGLLNPWSGEIRFRGESLNTLTPQAIVDRGIIHVPQGNTLFPRMTVFENLFLGAYSKRAWGKREENLERVLQLFPRLAERREQLCRTLSGGERQMLAIGVGLMGDARVLMLDEPTLGLAPKIKDLLHDAIEQVARSGIPLIIVEQDVEFLSGITDRLYLLEEGKNVLEVHESEMLDHAEILKRYFGETQSDISDK